MPQLWRVNIYIDVVNYYTFQWAQLFNFRKNVFLQIVFFFTSKHIYQLFQVLNPDAQMCLIHINFWRV